MRVSEARLEAAEALRRLGHAFVGHEISDDLMRRIATAALGILPELEAGRPRVRDIGYLKRAVFEVAPADGEPMAHFPECIVSGKANPMGIAIDMHRDGDE